MLIRGRDRRDKKQIKKEIISVLNGEGHVFYQENCGFSLWSERRKINQSHICPLISFLNIQLGISFLNIQMELAFLESLATSFDIWQKSK